MLTLLALGVLLGMKHALEPDHLVAVSTMLHKERRLLPALKVGATWGLGHTTTLALGVLFLFLLKLPLQEDKLIYFEAPVAVMLLLLGGKALYDLFTAGKELYFHSHDGLTHAHTFKLFDPEKRHFRSYFVGLVHGLAGSGAMMLFLAGEFPTPLEALLYTVLFGVGSMVGMVLVSCGIAIPFVASRNKPMLYQGLTLVAGATSLFLGGQIIWEIAHA